MSYVCTYVCAHNVLHSYGKLAVCVRMYSSYAIVAYCMYVRTYVCTCWSHQGVCVELHTYMRTALNGSLAWSDLFYCESAKLLT